MQLEDNFYVKEEGETDERYGCNPFKRPIQDYIRKGFVCIDKPMGPSSHEVVVWVRKILEVNKTGHTGTLDPRVTGVLPIMIEQATKLVQILQGSEKEYVCLMRLHGNVKREKIEEVMKMFEGKIYQRPPLKSAVKKRLRVREVKKIEILEIEGRDVLFKVITEAGTYIRKLCIDIGEVLGCGANMQELRRTRTGIFTEDMSYTLQDLLEQRAKLAFYEGVLDEDVIPYCSALAAQEHGDARKALDLLRTSGEIAEREGENRVTKEHVKKAVKKIESDQIAETVRTLPTHSKVLLFGMIILTESGYRKFTTGEVYAIYKNLCKKIGLDTLTQRRISDLISELDMLGIINSIVISKGRYGRTREIRVDMPVRI